MKINSSAFRKLAIMPSPTWDKDAITGFGDKLSDSMTLIGSPAWQTFMQQHAPAWEPELITGIKQHTPPAANYSKKDLLAFAERSTEYFQNYACTSHLYALKSMGNLQTSQRTFNMGGIWSVF